MPVAALAAPIAAELGGGLLATIGSEALVGAGLGAGGGALLGEITGGDPGKGALAGALTGGIGAGGGAALGPLIGPVAGGLVAGGAGGLIGAEATGGNPLTGALTGGALGAASGVLGGGSGGSAAPATAAGGGGSAQVLAGSPGPSEFGPLGASDVASFGAFPAAGGVAPTISGTGSSLTSGSGFTAGDLPTISADPTTVGQSGMASFGTPAPMSSAGENLIARLPGVDMATLETASDTSGVPSAGDSSGSSGGGNSFGTLGAADVASFGALPVAGFGGGSSGGTGDIIFGGAGGGGTGTSSGDITFGGSAGGSSSGFGSSVWNWLSKNPGVLLGGGLLGYELLQGNQNYPQEQALQALAQQAQNQAGALAAPATTGVLPPGEQAAVDLAVQGSKATAAGTYGSLGLSGSTMEAQAMQGADLEGAALKASIANNLLAQSANFSRIAGQDYTTVLNAEIMQDAALRQAIASFAGGLAGLRTPAAAA